MIEFCVPGCGDFQLAHLALDLNGTLALDGRLIDGVPDRLRVLSERLDVRVLTADTLGLAAEIGNELGVRVNCAGTSAEKSAFVERLGKESVVAVGNGTIDAGMFSVAALGIAVLGTEGLAREAYESADIIAPDILAALDLLLNTRRLVATLRR